MRYFLTILIITVFCSNRVQSQVGYQKDSLQIKVFQRSDAHKKASADIGASDLLI